MNKKAIAAIVVTLATVSACNVGADPKKGMGDAGIRYQGIDNHPVPRVIEFSDKYPNIEFKCNGVNGIYTNTRSLGYFVVIANDPECKLR